MNKFTKLFAVALIVLSSAACTRIESGEVGLRVNASKQVEGSELTEGTWAQTMVGSVIEFPVRDVAGTLENKNPPTKDDVAMKDVDVSYIYAINPSSVSDLWVKQSRSYHHVDADKNTYLMSIYVQTLMNNALYKAVRKHDTKSVNDKREQIEQDMKEFVAEQLKKDKLDTSLTVTQVLVRNMQIPDSIRDSAAQVVRSTNELLVKQNEVEIAKKEAERMAALSTNSKSSIEYMDAQARLNWSQAALNGKINATVVDQAISGKVLIQPK